MTSLSARRVPAWVTVPVIVLAVVGSGWLIWQRGSRAPVPRQRTAADFLVTWTCDQGHVSRAPGAAGARPCPVCGGQSYATFTCRCTNPKCGYTQQMQLRYDAELKIDAMRWRPDGQWQEYVFPPPCPKCGADMRPG